MRLRLAAAVCAAALASACGGASHDTTADLAAIGKIRDAYTAAFKAGDAAAIAAQYASDANVMNDGEATAAGTQAIQAANKATFDQMSSQSAVITAEKTDVSGDMAYDRGTYKASMTPKSGPAISVEGRYLVVLKRQADGSWKVVEDMGNLPTPPAPMPATPAKAPTKAPAKKG